MRTVVDTERIFDQVRAASRLGNHQHEGAGQAFGKRGMFRQPPYVVTAHEPDRLVEMRVEKPFPMTVRYEESRLVST